MGTKDSLMGRLLGSSEKFNDRQVSETIDLLVRHGVERGASDIHIEPHERFVLVRYRIDGTLRGIHKLPRPALGMVMAELKKQAGLHVHETATPQDGQYEAKVGDRVVDIHLSLMPVYGGEKAVLHLAMHRGKPLELEALGFWGSNLRTLQGVLASPHGLVVVAGPRHSGRAATLFSMLSQLNSPMVSIATVESQPKHRLPGVGHTYLAASAMTVSNGLQAALKQDPNIIMISDMPDGATAESAIHAATTGRLVLVGLHADGAVAAALRMRAAGVEPFLLATGLRAAVGQRLVRTLCADCRERYLIPNEELQHLRETFGINTSAAAKRVHDLERQAAADGLGDEKQLNSAPAGITHLWRAHPEGCNQCGHTGYQGRTALVEVLSNTEAVQKGLLDREINSVPALQRLALKDGFIPMALDGLIKALRGQTTIEEVLHATKPEATA